MRKELSNWRSDMVRMIRNNVGTMGLNSRDVQNRLSSESQNIMSRISNIGRTAQKQSFEHYKHIIQHITHQDMQSHNTNKRDPSIESAAETEFGWSDAAIAPLVVVVAPFIAAYLAFKGKDNAIEELIKKLNQFVSQIEQGIKKQTTDMTNSFSAIRQKVKAEFTSKA